MTVGTESLGVIEGGSLTEAGKLTARVLSLIGDLPGVLDEHVRQSGIPGAIVGIYHRGRYVMAASQGGTNAPGGLTKDTRLRAGCTMKPITATLLAKLVSTGVISFSQPFVDLLPNIPQRLRRTYAGVNVGHLLTHTHGLNGETVQIAGQIAEVLEQMARQPPLAEPGEIYSYSNIGFSLLGSVLESVHGRPYREILETELFGPLGIVGGENTDAGAFCMGEGRQVKVEFAPRFPDAGGGGAIALSALEHLKFLRLHLGHRLPNFPHDVPALTRSSLTSMPTPDGYVESVSAGWYLYSTGFWGSHGMSAGQQLLTRFCPMQDLAFLLATPAYPAYSLARALFGGTYEDMLAPIVSRSPPGDMRRHDGVYANDIGVVEVECAGDHLELRIRPAGPNALRAPTAATRHAKPVGGNAFSLEPMNFFGGPRISFVETHTGSDFLWNGTMVWRKV